MQSYISDLVNAGVYVFDAALLSAIGEVVQASHAGGMVHQLSRMSIEDSGLATDEQPARTDDYIHMETHIFESYAGRGFLFAFESDDFWCVCKTPGYAAPWPRRTRCCR